MTLKDALSAINNQSSLTIKFIQLLSEATKIWATYAHDECPNEAWLKTYLETNVPDNDYQAFTPADLVWAIYNYFTFEEPGKSDDLDALMEGLEDLRSFVVKAGIPMDDWPVETYVALGLTPPATAREANKTQASRQPASPHQNKHTATYPPPRPTKDDKDLELGRTPPHVTPQPSGKQQSGQPHPSPKGWRGIFCTYEREVVAQDIQPQPPHNNTHLKDKPPRLRMGLPPCMSPEPSFVSHPLVSVASASAVSVRSNGGGLLPRSVSQSFSNKVHPHGITGDCNPPPPRDQRACTDEVQHG